MTGLAGVGAHRARAITDRGSRPSAERPSAELTFAHRVVTFVAAIALFGVCFATWATSVQLLVTNIVSFVGFGAALALAAAALTVRTGRRLMRVDAALLLASIGLLIGWAISTVYFQSAYGTDEAAFEQYAAMLMTHGTDPYGANLLPALSMFRVPVQFATFTMSGSTVSQLGYPALPVLLIAAAVPLTHGFQTVVIVNVVALAVTTIVMFRLLPAPVRALGPLVVVGLPILFGFAVAGVNAIIMMALLVVVAHRWCRVGVTGQLSRSDYVRAVALGLAISTQQLAWFVTPFVLIGIYLSRRGQFGRGLAARLAGRYAGIAVGTFLALNATFIAWGPEAWLRGVLSPLTQNAIPYGQGLVDLTLFLHIGGGRLRYYTYAAALLYLGLLALFAVNYRTLGPAAFILPSIALYVPTRSLGEYFMCLVAVWTVAAATTRSADFATAAAWHVPLRLTGWAGGRGRAVLAVVAILPALAAVVFAATAPAPLDMTITGITTNGQLQSVWRVTARVTNNSDDALQPHFATNYIGQATSYWNVLQGPATLAPHTAATYSLAAPNRGSMPGITTPFTLQAVTDSPDTISSSTLYTPANYSASIDPEYVDAVLPAGSGTTLHVQLRSSFGRLVHKAGVEVALAQLIYAQTALIPAEAVINGRPQGQTPVYADTDAAGVATFHITDDSPQGQPIYFQSWVLAPTGYPYGYSEIVPIFWAAHPGGNS